MNDHDANLLRAKASLLAASQPNLAAIRALHQPEYPTAIHRVCQTCHVGYPCLVVRLCDYIDAQAERLARAEEWQSSVSGALRSWEMFESGEWGGDKSGWGYHVALIGFLIRHYAQYREVLRTYGSHLEGCTIGKGTPCSCGFDGYLFGVAVGDGPV